MSTTNVANLKVLVDTAAGDYISQNSETFKSIVAGPTGPRGLPGASGESVTVSSIVNNGDGTLTLTFSDGFIHTTDILTGDRGSDGVDGTSIIVSSIVNNQDGSLTLEFSDGYQHTTAVLIGEQGIRGIQGVSVHHTKPTSTTDPEGDFSTPGQTDTYTFYGDADELLNLGSFSIINGDSAYAYAVEGGFEGSNTEFIEILGQIDDIVDAANNAITQVQGYATSAAANELKAEKWAEETTDTPVDPGKFSSKHWAEKSSDSATEASASASTANTSALNASNSEGNAFTHASTAIASKDAAAISETNAASSADNASTSETNAASSESVASGSASQATIKASEALASADTALASATSAGISETNAANSAIDAANALTSKQDTLVNQTNIKSINGTTILGSGDLTVSAGSGGFAADLYFSDVTSTINGLYKQLSYIPDGAETSPTIVCNNGETAGQVYLFELPIDTTVIDAGKWVSNFYCSVNSTTGDTRLRIEGFMRATGGAETTLFTATSPELTDVPGTVEWSTTEPVINVDATSRYGIRVFASTTANSDKTVTYVVGNGNASYTNTPAATRHSQLRARDAEDSHPISAITGLQAIIDGLITEVEW